MTALFAVLLLAGLDATPRPPAPTPTPPVSALDVPAPKATAAPVTVSLLPRVGVLTIGDDSLAGPLQKDLERVFAASPDLKLRTGSEMASRLVVPRVVVSAPVGPDPAAKAEATQLLEEAKGAYYDDASAKALDRLAKLESLQERSGGFPALQRIEMRLWRVAVFLALKDEQQASDEGLAALSIDPELRIDLKELPPSVNDEVEKVRSTRLKIFSVNVSGLPPVADVNVDGRSVPSRFRAAAGHHRITVNSPGRREVVREVDVARDVSVSIPLPLAVPAEADAAAVALAWPVAGATVDPTPIAALATKLDVDWIVVVSTRATPKAEARAMAVSAKGGAAWIGSATASSPTLAQTLGDEAIPALRKSIARANRPKSGGSHVAADEGAGWTLGASAALALDARYRSLSGSGGSVKTLFAGTGPQLGIRASNGATLASLDVAWTTFGFSSLAVKLPDGSTRTASGGSTLGVSLAGGRRVALSSNGFEDGPTLRYGLGLVFEDHSATDVTSSSGGKLGLLSSYLRIAPELRGGARIPLTEFAISGDLGISPVGYWVDTPSKVYGKSATAIPAFGWRFAASRGDADRLRLEVAWTGSLSGANHTGVAAVPSTPPMSSVKVRENVQALTVGLTKRF